MFDRHLSNGEFCSVEFPNRFEFVTSNQHRMIEEDISTDNQTILIHETIFSSWTSTDIFALDSSSRTFDLINIFVFSVVFWDRDIPEDNSVENLFYRQNLVEFCPNSKTTKDSMWRKTMKKTFSFSVFYLEQVIRSFFDDVIHFFQINFTHRNDQLKNSCDNLM